MPPIIRKRTKQIDNATRARIIKLVINQAKTMASVARTFNIPASTVRSVVNTFIRTNRIAPLPRGGKRISRIEQSHIDWLIENMDEFVGRSAEWLTNKLNEHFQIRPPLSQRTVDRAVNKLTIYTLKLMRAEPERYNEPERIEVRRQWSENVLRSPGTMNQFVYIDEAGFNLLIRHRYGRVPRGRRVSQRVPYKRGPNMSLVIAVDKTGILAHHFKLGVFNQENFTEFLEDHLFPRLNARHRILLIDNAKLHKTQTVKDTITGGGHSLLLPPCCPHLNAAEFVFNSVNTHVRQEVVQTETLSGHVASGLARIDAATARVWIREVERNIQLSLAGTPLGRLCDARPALPEGYQDPYVECWDDGPEPGDDVDVDGDENEDEEEEDDEGGEARSHARSRCSPLRTRSGKTWN